MNKLPDLPPEIYSLSACIVGFLLIDDMDANEQNALGNWLMLVAQVLCTNAYFQQLQDSKKSNNMTNEDVVNMMNKMANALHQEINDLKANL